jgi:(R)-2-hydroxyacyl-CoA dehydratese activating ATPase
VILAAGVDVGSTYTKAAIVSDDGQVLGRALVPTGFRLSEAATRALGEALGKAGVGESDVAYVVSTGYGRYQVPFRDVQVTDLTAQATGARRFFPGTRTVLDMGGQTMKASRLDERGRVKSFRLNDKCAAGTGAFLEKTARYLGYPITEVGELLDTSTQPVPISGVCAVFAESEVINQVSSGASPADIMHGAIVSLADRSVQLMKRAGLEPEFTLVGGIARFAAMARVLGERLKAAVNVPLEDFPQYTAAIGAALLGQRRLRKLREEGRLDVHLGERPTAGGSAP